MNEIIVLVFVILIFIVIIVVAVCTSTSNDSNSYEIVKYEKDIIHGKLYTMMEMLDIAFNNANIEYVVAWGTLLGSIREGKIIDHDDDIDIIVFDDKKDEMLKMLNDIEKMGKYKVHDAGFGYKLVDKETHIEGQDNGAQIDLFLYTKHENEIEATPKSCEAFPEGCKIKSEWVFPIRKHKFNNFKVNIPHNPEKILTQLYGNWKVPVVYNHGRLV